MSKYKLPILATVLAIGITTTMDFTGYFIFSALPLLLISLIFWAIQRQNKAEIGLKFGKINNYGLAFFYPLIVLGSTTLIAFAFEELNTNEADWGKESIKAIVGITVGSLLTLLTEEGFFRGWLWSSFIKAGMTPKMTLIVTSLLFTIWHISAVTSGTSFGLPLTQVPVYLINATLLGLIWGLLRLSTGSVIVPAVCHAVWNAFAYGLFGFGEKTGALGIIQTFLLGPEVGYLGIVLNGAFFLWLWRRSRHLIAHPIQPTVN